MDSIHWCVKSNQHSVWNIGALNTCELFHITIIWKLPGLCGHHPDPLTWSFGPQWPLLPLHFSHLLSPATVLSNVKSDFLQSTTLGVDFGISRIMVHFSFPLSQAQAPTLTPQPYWDFYSKWFPFILSLGLIWWYLLHKKQPPNPGHFTWATSFMLLLNSLSL